MSFLAVEMKCISLLTCYISVIIVAIGASRIYRGLVDSASNHREAQASSKCCDELQPEVVEVKDNDIV